MGRLTSEETALRCLSLIHEVTGARLIDGVLTPTVASLHNATLLLDAIRADVQDQKHMLVKHGAAALNHAVQIK